MILSDISVTRPVLATVLSLLLIAFGLVAFDRLPLQGISGHRPAGRLH
jgi:multidrug efflux pump